MPNPIIYINRGNSSFLLVSTGPNMAPCWTDCDKRANPPGPSGKWFWLLSNLFEYWSSGGIQLWIFPVPSGNITVSYNAGSVDPGSYGTRFVISD